MYGFLLGSDLGQERRLVTARPGRVPLCGDRGYLELLG
jgi:hypothetical protein